MPNPESAPVPDDYTPPLQSFVSAIRSSRLIPAEACAIFEVEPLTPATLVLRAHDSDKGSEFEPIALPIQSVKGGGLTGHIANLGKPVRLHGAELTAHPYRSRNYAPYLHESPYSILAVPVRDSRNRLVALLKLTNRKDNEGNAIEFTQADENAAEAISGILSHHFEARYQKEAQRSILDVIGSDRTRREVFEAVLLAGKRILRAEHGLIAVGNATPVQLIVKAVVGEPQCHVNEAIEEGTLLWKVWESADSGPVFNPDNSEVAVPVISAGRRLGVLAFESTPGSFSRTDTPVLRDLAAYARIPIAPFSGDSSVTETARFFSEPVIEDTPELEALLETALDDPSLSALLYFANDFTRRLECIASLRVPSGSAAEPFDAKQIEYGYDQVSFAAAVRRQREPLFSCDDPYQDSRVHLPIARRCGIQGTILGVPLLKGSEVVGVLIVWKAASSNEKYWQDPREREDLQRKLLTQSRFWAYGLRGIESARRKDAVLKEIQRMSAWGAGNQKDRLNRIGFALLADGFDRVRLFGWDAERKVFVGWYCWGMPAEEERRFAGLIADPQKNPYTKATRERALINPGAVRFDPRTDPRGMDPDGAATGKGTATPWAVVPLVFNGELYGQIAADMLETGRQISDEHLQYMTTIGALAAHMIASEAFIEREARARVQQQLDEALEVILHTIKTPVHSIFGYFSFLQAAHAARDAGRMADWMARLEQQIEWLEELMQDSDTFVNSMSRYRVSEEESLVDVANVAIAGVEPQSSKKKLKIELRVPGDNRCQFAGDPYVVRIIIQNLLDNAVKFAPRGSRIDIRLSPEPARKRYLVTITDQGPGMGQGEAKGLLGEGLAFPKLTDPESHGLGLAIARALAVRIGGELHYTGQGSTRGAAFTLVLPDRSAR